MRPNTQVQRGSADKSRGAYLALGNTMQGLTVIAPTPVSAFEFNYSSEDDTLNVRWSGEPSTHGTEVGPRVIVRLNDANMPLGLTIYGVGQARMIDTSRDLGPQVSALTAHLLSEYSVRQR